ncbi:VCBS repeat-containing protein [Halobacillus litoralis]|uniref:VCBS repeat-containing protein n=1 Tax=Halobacillus litoralis TaxID=45668 RepID=UPI001CD5D937|nr:VCBS repeat-containing protein [Halobacillus litoralis]MCA0972021.1 VCBS repeat-containing protein [Halobacillus litoralis]
MYPFFQNRENQTTILSVAEGDVNGDHIQDYVYLVGQPLPDSPYMTAITLVIQDGKTNEFFTIPLKEDQGYDPRVTLQDFTGDGIDDIFIRINSGGSGGYGYFFIYSFVNNKVSLLFDYETFNGMFLYDVIYQDDYRVKVVNQTLNLSFIIDLSNRNPEYLADLYNKDGTLIKPLEGSVSGLNQLYPIDFNGDGVYELDAYQRIIGQYNADQLGVVQTPLSFEKNGFTLFIDNQYVSVVGQTDV